MNHAEHAEIDDNDLAKATMSVVDRIRPHFATIAAAVAALAVGLAAWTLTSAQRDTAQEQSWDAVWFARGNDQLATVATQYPDTAAGTWSRILLADELLADGTRVLFVDKVRGRELLRQAAAEYQAVTAAKVLPPLAAERATFGLARAREASGQIDEARRGYESLAREHADSPLRAQAEQRAAALARAVTVGWYDWFEKDAQPATPATTGAEPAVSGTTAPAG